MNWSEFFTEWGGGTYFEYFIEDLSQKGEIILIDSRTGVTELGGICTHHLADLVLLLTASNEQNREGSARMVESLNRPEVRALHGGRDVAVLPIASRIDTRGGGSLAEKFVSEFGKQFADLATKWAQQGVAFLELSRIPYVGAYSFQERVIAREPDDPARAEPLAPYLAITEAVPVKYLRSRALMQSIVARVISCFNPSAPRTLGSRQRRTLCLHVGRAPKTIGHLSSAPGSTRATYASCNGFHGLRWMRRLMKESFSESTPRSRLHARCPQSRWRKRFWDSSGHPRRLRADSFSGANARSNHSSNKRRGSPDRGREYSRWSAAGMQKNPAICEPGFCPRCIADGSKSQAAVGMWPTAGLKAHRKSA